MNIEASRYDDQLNDIRWEAEKALEENKEQQKDILHLQKHSSEDRFHIIEMQWDMYGKGDQYKIPRQTAWQDAGIFIFKAGEKVLNGAV